MPDSPTRQTCNRCHLIYGVDWFVPKPLWRQVAGEHWEHSCLCLACFQALGDERGIAWEESMEFYPISLRTHLEKRVKGDGGT